MWAFGGFVLGAGFLAAAIGATGHSSFSISSSPADIPQAGADSRWLGSQRLVLSVVKSDEIDSAIESMNLPLKKEMRVRRNLESHKYRLLWLTLWDWDTQTSTGDTISIASNKYHRVLTLKKQHSRIAIPEPKSGTIELRGEHTEDAITISMLSDTQPVAMPRMAVGQRIKINIDTP